MGEPGAIACRMKDGKLPSELMLTFTGEVARVWVKGSLNVCEEAFACSFFLEQGGVDRSSESFCPAWSAPVAKPVGGKKQAVAKPSLPVQVKKMSYTHKWHAITEESLKVDADVFLCIRTPTMSPAQSRKRWLAST